MILGIEDKSKENIAFSVESIVLIKKDPESEEHCLLYLAHIGGVAVRVHFTPAEFVSQIGGAMDQMQGRANLLGLMQPPGRPKQ
ncbi:MAG TPA: hypothetical protein VNS88_06955 [Nitrospiraceae bacterium]|nr:hypothetical protein [Nitrospiraceae bacterium]